MQQSLEERRETAARSENNVNQVWDQIRLVENALSQRLTMAETSQVRKAGYLRDAHAII